MGVLRGEEGVGGGGGLKTAKPSHGKVALGNIIRPPIY